MRNNIYPAKYGMGTASYAQDILEGRYLHIGDLGVFLTKTDPSGNLK